jgi:hypothetical protein
LREKSIDGHLLTWLSSPKGTYKLVLPPLLLP